MRESRKGATKKGMEGENMGTVCVTGGTGYVASWLITRLLQHGYSVNTTVRSDTHGKKRDLSFLTNLPAASEKLRIFVADLDKPGSFESAIEGCVGVFHTAHPIDFEDEESEEVKTKRAINGTLGILQACIDSKTVRRVVYTSSASAVEFNDNDLATMDESMWSDIDFLRAQMGFGRTYMITKTLTERAALEFAEKHELDLVTVIPSFVHGPFITPNCPSSVLHMMSLIFGNSMHFGYLSITPIVHVDDVASAHIFLFEYTSAKGRYICSALEIGLDKMVEMLLARYPQYQIPSIDLIGDVKQIRLKSLSSKKLLDTGFKYKYGLEDMFDGAIRCCKEKGHL